ncbi:MAG: hypothetical protein JO303_04585 [Caulobacteraceae bacterium]|nr:hypothetical protein [Caulobacteraceae bacterium]
MSRKRDHRDQGSVVADALVAIGVMAITLTYAGQVIGDSALRAKTGEQRRLAELEARSRMAEVGADIPLAPGQARGEDGDLVWTVDISPATDTPNPGGGLLEIDVSAGVHGTPDLVTLRSLRVGGA